MGVCLPKVDFICDQNDGNQAVITAPGTGNLYNIAVVVGSEMESHI